MASSPSPGGRAYRSDAPDLIRFDELELVGLIEFLRECPGRLSAATVPGPEVGEALIERLRITLTELTIEVAEPDAAPGEIGTRALELGSSEGNVLVVPLDGRRNFASEEDAVAFWRWLNYQRERLASGSVRTCLLVDEEGERRLALLADDLLEWIHVFRFPAAIPLHPVEMSPAESAGIEILKNQLRRAREAGMPDGRVIRDYAAPLFSALVGARRMAEARGIWERDLMSGDLGVLDLLVPDQREGILAAGQQLGGQDTVLADWFAQVAKEHRRLSDHFERPVELRDLETAWVRLDLALDSEELAPDSEDLAHSEELAHEDLKTGERRRTVEHFLALDTGQHAWVTRRWLVEGDPGAGKTTLLRHLAGRLAVAGDRQRVPLFIPLPRVVEPPRMPLEFVAEEYGTLCGPRLFGELDEAGQEGRLVVLLDGLDEVPPERRERVRRLLGRLESDWPRSSVVVTSRPIGLGEPPPGFQKLLLQPLDDVQRRRFLENWFRHREGSDWAGEARRASVHFDSERGLRELSHNPLHLTLLTVLWEQGVKAPTRRSQLYDAIFDLLLEGRHRDKPVAIPAVAVVREALRYLAFSLTCDDLPAEEPDQLERRLWDGPIDDVRERLVKIWGPQLRGFLNAVHERTYILGPHDGPRSAWRFWHRTFREALTAEWLKEIFEEHRDVLLGQLRPPGGAPRFLSVLRTWWRGDRNESANVRKELSLAFHQGDEGRWAEPFALLAGHLDDPDALVRSLVRANRALGLRALATAQGLSADVLTEMMKLSGGWKKRRKVFESIPEQLGEAEACLALIDRLRRDTRDGNDLFFLYGVTEEVARRWPACAQQVQQLRNHFFDHIPTPEDPELFRSIDTPRDGRIELWREIAAGEGWIGSPESEKGRHSDEGPRHRVTIKRPFQMAAVPVTHSQYAAFDPAGGNDQRPDYPVANVTWYEAVSFCRWLAAQVPGCSGARLPIEEEWEYACRAGTKTRYWSGDSEEALAEVGWYGKNSGHHAHSVGEKRANPWGLYDVHGNVWEWTASPWAPDYSGRGTGITVDPAVQTADLAASRGDWRVFRGGGFSFTANWSRAAYRDWGDPRDEVWDRGFRVVRLPPPERH